MRNHTVGLLALAAFSNACFAQAQLKVLQAPLDGVFNGVAWTDNYCVPLAVSGDGSVIVGLQGDRAYDFNHSAAVRWSVQTGEPIDYLVPEEFVGEFSVHMSVNWDGLIYSTSHNLEYLLFVNGLPSVTQIVYPTVSMDGQRVFGLVGSSVGLVNRSNGSVIVQCNECSSSSVYKYEAELSTRGDAFSARNVYWREGFGVLMGNSLTPPVSFGAVSGDGRWVYAHHFSQQLGNLYFRYSFENGLESRPAGYVESVSEHAEVEVSQSWIKTPRHGVESIAQFLTREGINLSALGSNTPYGQLISRDGRTLVGYTFSPTGTCWTVRLSGDYLCDSIDFNNDTSLFDPQDIAAFLSRYSEGPCIPESATCNDIDFNNDTNLFDPEDINAFLRVYSEGPCIE